MSDEKPKEPEGPPERPPGRAAPGMPRLSIHDYQPSPDVMKGFEEGCTKRPPPKPKP